MAQTSFNIQPCKVTASERHNKREKALSYVRPELSHLNEWCDFLNVHLVAYDAQMRKLVKEKTGRKMQEKSRALYEGIAVIRPDTTIEDIKKLADAMHQRFGFHFVQLAIHKDEGSWQKDGTWKANLHAHMVFDKIDHETGKTIKTTGKDTAEMQDMCAQILGMERGKKGSKAKHLDAIDYKVKVQEERARLAEEQREAASKRASELSIKNADASIAFMNKKAELTRTTREVEKIRSTLSFERGRVDYRQKQLEGLKSEISGLEGKKSEALDIIAQKEQAEKDIQSLKSMERDMNMQLDVITGEVVKQEGWRDTLKEEVETLTQERDKAKRETAAARESLQNLTANRDRVQNWKWGFHELMKLVKPILDAIKRFAHVDGRGARFTPGEVVLIDFALGRDDKREERAERYTRWAEEEEEHPRLYGGYRYQCAGEHMKMIAENAAGYYNSVSQSQGRGMGY